MSTPEAIEKINNATHFGELESEFKILMKLTHADVCSSDEANEAATKLSGLKTEWTKGIKYEDESGTFRSKGLSSIYEGDPVLLKKSLSNYNELLKLKDPSSLHFHKYLPKSMEMKDGELHVTFSKRAVPLTAVKKLDQVHVNWIVSRILEFSSWMSSIGFCHCGLNLESVYILPESHGIQIGSFYMIHSVGDALKGVSGKYKTWYPPSIFTNKKAVYSIDITLAKKIGVYLLGDQSGVGTKLKRDASVNKEILNFLIEHSEDPLSTWKHYRELLDKLFEKKFYKLKI